MKHRTISLFLNFQKAIYIKSRFSSPKSLTNGSAHLTASHLTGLFYKCLHLTSQTPTTRHLSVLHCNRYFMQAIWQVSSALLRSSYKASIPQTASLLVLKPSHPMAKPATVTTEKPEQKPGTVPAASCRDLGRHQCTEVPPARAAVKSSFQHQLGSSYLFSVMLPELCINAPMSPHKPKADSLQCSCSVIHLKPNS